MAENSAKSAVGNFCGALQTIRIRQSFPRGAKLFEQGQPVKGIYLIQTGRVRLWVRCSSGLERLVATVGHGSLLALSEAISGEPHNLSAQTVRDSEVFFVPRETLLKFASEHSDFCMQVVDLLSEDLHGLYDELHDLARMATRPPRRAVRPGIR